MRSRIRKSADYRIFAPARSLSQLVTSFFGSWCQGIRLVLFVTWPLACLFSFLLCCSQSLRYSHTLVCSVPRSFGALHKSENPAQPLLSHSFQDKHFSNTHTSVYVWDFITTVLLVVKIFWFSRLINEIVFWDLSQNPQNFEKTLLWFISISFSLLTCYTQFDTLFSFQGTFQTFRFVVENKGFEPLTPCVQGRCSPSWANSPYKLIVQKLKSP